MSKLSKKPLMNLSKETKQLVNQGIFSLYALTAPQEGAEFVLYTDSKAYLLSVSGDILVQADLKARFPVKESITFTESELGIKTITFGKHNFSA